MPWSFCPPQHPIPLATTALTATASPAAHLQVQNQMRLIDIEMMANHLEGKQLPPQEAMTLPDNIRTEALDTTQGVVRRWPFTAPAPVGLPLPNIAASPAWPPGSMDLMKRHRTHAFHESVAQDHLHDMLFISSYICCWCSITVCSGSLLLLLKLSTYPDDRPCLHGQVMYGSSLLTSLQREIMMCLLTMGVPYKIDAITANGCIKVDLAICYHSNNVAIEVRVPPSSPAACIQGQALRVMPRLCLAPLRHSFERG